jgi:hypothetical protein
MIPQEPMVKTTADKPAITLFRLHQDLRECPVDTSGYFSESIGKVASENPSRHDSTQLKGNFPNRRFSPPVFQTKIQSKLD